MASTVLGHNTRPTAPLTPNNHQPRPSPTKRALSSPNSSPPLGYNGQQESPRVLRTKLSSCRDVTESMGLETNASSQGEEGMMCVRDGTPATPPEPASVGRQGLIGLGVGLPQEETIAAEMVTNDEGATQTKTAQEQQRQLLQMPVELHQALAKLSSQHHAPNPPSYRRRRHPLSSLFAPPRPPAPPLPLPISIPAAPAPAPSTRPPILRAATNWPSIFRPVINLANSVTSTPTDRSRSSTPPVSTSTSKSTAELQVRGATPSTSLTPTLANLAFDSSSSTPLNGPRTPQDDSPTKDIAAALQDALKSNLDRTGEVNAVPEEREPTPPPAPVFKAPAHAQPPPPMATTNGLLPGMKIINGVAVKTSVSHPMNISALVPPEYLARFAQAIFTDSSSTPSSSTSKPKSPLMDSTSLVSNSNSSSAPSPFLLARPPIGDLWDLLSTALPTAEGTALPLNPESAICRDVSLDLGRAKEEGVGLVVCCLDDSELSFLGAPWSEYSHAASSHSLAVIRIPMVEGFAPSSPSSLDAQLDKVIRQYTLQGRSVLAHCRGGIGRAGLVACCWLIKMAFVGAGEEEGGGEGRTMRVVERVIEVIRKRRSVKSIETPVQVAFLLAYVAYLQEQATIVKASELA
ncbi:hypothetical protein BCR35DRAFT_310840 [Leucosporidium creatinivorum]|uniref:Tyrosine specific protein phosphatases domain-containing protein n=1 Tax=Leucosporidium creatinivorum TaxID=106004 RepID=A0A1Y2CP70_9BASI|nr:hypothetical protein BCR35DRAFT_310840 [Leucosporidium creatinivorum]